MPGLRGAVSILVLASALAGCVATQPVQPAGSEQVGAPTAPTFAAPVVVDAARDGFEPSLDILDDGTVFICSPRGAPAGTKLWRSLDGGATFAFVGNQPPADAAPPLRSGTGDLGGGDCDLGHDAGGRLYLADLWVGSASVSSTSDRGATWRGTPVSQVSGLMDRPWVLGGEADEVFVTGASLQGTGFEPLGLATPPVGGIYVARSTDGGQTFPQQALAAPNDQRLGLNGNLAAGPQGLYIVYGMKLADGILGVMVAVSTDRGLTWTQHLVAEQPFYPGQCFSPFQLFPVVAADAAGGVYLAWTLQNPETERIDLFMAASRDGGQHWNRPVLLTDRPGTRLYPWMVAGDAGRVGIAWYESSASRLEAKDPSGLQCTWAGEEQPEWFLHYAFSADAAADAPAFVDVLVQTEPIHQGELDRPYAEVLQLEFDPMGRAAVAYVADVAEGAARPMFALQAEGPLGRASPMPRLP